MKLNILLSLLILSAAGYAAQQIINVGTTPGDGTGDTVRSAFIKVNDNFTEVYTNHPGDVAIGGNLTVATNVTVGGRVSAQTNVTIYSRANRAALTISDDVENNTIGIVLENFGTDKININPYGLRMYNGATIEWSSTASYPSTDTRLYRDAAGTLALRNGVNPQEFRFYSTYTDASNYERGSLQADAGVVTLAAESSGTGSADMDLAFKVNGNGAIYAESASGVAGNARGNNAVDLQVYRSAATQVASGNYSTVVGAGSKAAGLGSVALGYLAMSSGTYAVGVGSGSDASGAYSLSMGTYGTASGLYSVTIGRLNTASATSSQASGLEAQAHLYGQQANASGRFSAAGDAQSSKLIARNTTSGTTPADLFLDGSSARLVLPANTSWGFTASIVGRTTDAGTGAEQSGYYEVKGLIKRDGASNTTLVGSVTKTVLAEDDATWDVTVSADDTNEALDISCTGGTGDNVRWVATVTLTEVGG